MVMRQQNKRVGVVRGFLAVLAAMVVLASGDFIGAHAMSDKDGAEHMKIVGGGDVHFDEGVVGARGLGSSSGGGGSSSSDSSDSKSGSSSSDSSDSKSGSSSSDSSDSKSGSSSSDSSDSKSSSGGKGHKRNRYLK